MVVAYRHQAQVEDMFRISKSRRPGLWLARASLDGQQTLGPCPLLLL